MFGASLDTRGTMRLNPISFADTRFFQLYVVQFCCRLLRLSRGGVAAPGDTGFSFLFASEPKIMGKVLGIVYRTIDTHLTRYLER